MNTHLILAVLALLLVAGCTQGTTGDAMEKDGDAMEKDGDAMEKKASVTVNTQAVENGWVTIASVYADQAGWLVIHADDGGAPSTVLGQTAVQAGNNTNVQVSLDTENATTQLHAMLHIDAGTSGVYEFPGADAPVTVDGDVVNVPFTTTGDAMEKKPSVTVSNQPVQDGWVTIASVYADQAGWLVIHADDGGAPSTVLGQTAVAAGSNTSVTVSLDTENVTEQLHAMLHIDAGTAGEYEFPGDDAPVTVDGEVVNVAFSTAEDVSLDEAIENMTEFMEANGGDTSTTPVAEDQDFSATMSRSGDFVNVNYMTDGSATLESKDGENFVVFSDSFSTPNGPDLVVYLGKNSTPTTRGDISAGIELAELKSTNGKQVYTIPQGVDISEYNSVNIHCRAFNVPWSYAPFS